MRNSCSYMSYLFYRLLCVPIMRYDTQGLNGLEKIAWHYVLPRTEYLSFV